TGIINLHGFNRFSYYGKPGARLENITMFFGPTRIWQYDPFVAGEAYEGQESISNMFRLRGGWNGSLNVSRNFFTFDSSAYNGLYLAGPDGLQPYLPPATQVTGLWDVSLTATTPTFHKFNATTTVARNEVAIFAEGSTGRELRATGGLKPQRTE